MQKPIIGIDVDDVLSQSAAAFVAYSNQRWGTTLTVDDYDDHWAQMWQIGLEDAEARALEFHQADIVGEYLVMDDALPVLRELQQRFDLVITTSRQRMIETSTREWLDKHYRGLFKNITFAGIFDDPTAGSERWAKTKADLYALHKVDYVIDDQLKHCQAAADAGVPALLFGNYKWNQTNEPLPNGITRVANWQEVGDYFARVVPDVEWS